MNLIENSVLRKKFSETGHSLPEKILTCFLSASLQQTLKYDYWKKTSSLWKKLGSINVMHFKKTTEKKPLTIKQFPEKTEFYWKLK